MPPERKRRVIEEVALYATLVSALISILSVPQLFPEAWRKLGSVSDAKSVGPIVQSPLKAEKVHTSHTNGRPSKQAPAGFVAGLWGGMSGVLLLPLKGLPPYARINTGWMYHYPGFLIGGFLMSFLFMATAAISDEMLEDRLGNKVFTVLASAAGVHFVWFIVLFPLFIFWR